MPKEGFFCILQNSIRNYHDHKYTGTLYISVSFVTSLICTVCSVIHLIVRIKEIAATEKLIIVSTESSRFCMHFNAKYPTESIHSPRFNLTISAKDKFAKYEVSDYFSALTLFIKLKLANI